MNACMPEMGIMSHPPSHTHTHTPSQLEAYYDDEDPSTVAGEFGNHSLYKNLGYFSLIGLLRLHTQLGDYYQALQAVTNVQLSKKVSPSLGVWSCPLMGSAVNVWVVMRLVAMASLLHRCWRPLECQPHRSVCTTTWGSVTS